MRSASGRFVSMREMFPYRPGSTVDVEPQPSDAVVAKSTLPPPAPAGTSRCVVLVLEDSTWHRRL
ncbi:hypothetical protein [Medusavirus stheno T3]|uniref:Uncharacterized protein n=1 Tax=Medusavirus stheno T3 TaxID=3069717 RepID=A0A7S8BES1_9VIRU|nr:hypothetical protein QKU73_gp352 [Acanthamoeba castellanii medusavirus]QPB44423.1 hypothetical protein [Medusavirus stheno T3]